MRDSTSKAKVEGSWGRYLVLNSDPHMLKDMGRIRQQPLQAPLGDLKSQCQTWDVSIRSRGTYDVPIGYGVPIGYDVLIGSCLG